MPAQTIGEVAAQVSLHVDTVGVGAGGTAGMEKHELDATRATTRQVKRQLKKGGKLEETWENTA